MKSIKNKNQKFDAIKEVSKMFTKLFRDLNQQCGLDVKLDSDSFSKSLESIIEINDKEELEILISEAYSYIRSALHFTYLNATMLLSEKIFNKSSYIISEDKSDQDNFNAIEQLHKFMKSFNKIYKGVYIPNAELELAKLSEKKGKELSITPKVQDLLKALLPSLSSRNNETSDELNPNK